MAHIHSVAMLILLQPDLEKAVVFYKNLGLRLKFHMRNKWAEFELSGVSIGLCPTSKPSDALVRTGIVLGVDDIQSFYEQHKNSIDFLHEPTTAVHGHMVSFKDPGGNILDLYQPTPEKVQELMRAAQESEDCQSEANTKTEKKCCRGNGKPCS